MRTPAGTGYAIALIRILGARVLDSVHNHHNFAWRENHNGKDLWVVRKGATPAFPAQKGFVGGTMSETSVILEGVENEQASLSLYSTVHGAGRVMGRMEAKGKRNKTGEWTRPPKVTQEMMDSWVSHSRVELRGGGVDESPHCYKRLPEVLAEHSDSVRLLHTLKPLGVAMAGKDVYDRSRIEAPSSKRKSFLNLESPFESGWGYHGRVVQRTGPRSSKAKIAVQICARLPSASMWISGEDVYDFERAG